MNVAAIVPIVEVLEQNRIPYWARGAALKIEKDRFASQDDYEPWTDAFRDQIAQDIALYAFNEYRRRR